MKRNPAIPSEPIHEASQATILLDFPLVSQKTGWTCGPAAAYAILRYFYGKTEWTEQGVADVMETRKLYGTKPVEMYGFLNFHFPRTRMSCRTPIRSLKKAIDRGFPVVVLWNDWKGHWAVCIGYNKSHILLADPANKRSGMRYHKVKNFRKHWHATVAGKKYRQLAIICRKP